MARGGSGGSGRWDWLEGIRAKSVAETLVQEAAKVLADLLREFPPALEFSDDATARLFAPLYAPDAPPVRPEILVEGLRLAALDLERQYDALDHYIRNDHAARIAATAHDRLALDLVWKFCTEWSLDLSERTDGRLKRPMLVQCLQQAGDRILPRKLLS